MKMEKISKYVEFLPGINPTRADKQFGDKMIDYYDKSSFETDCKYEEGLKDKMKQTNVEEDICLKVGDVIISNSLQKATIVGDSNIGKVLSLNFTKVIFKNKTLDKMYFIYLFNSNSSIARQKEKELQGTGLTMRIPIKSLNDLAFPIIPINEQHKIGKAYHKMLILQNKLQKYSELTDKLAIAVLEENLKER
ncbi:MAG: restriction endonuclease subunit S [Erysipelotrichaceae bacterium]